jgi:hypothetical protein
MTRLRLATPGSPEDRPQVFRVPLCFDRGAEVGGVLPEAQCESMNPWDTLSIESH